MISEFQPQNNSQNLDDKNQKGNIDLKAYFRGLSS